VLIAKFMADFSEKRVVKAAFYGIRPAVTALIAVAVIGLFEMALITGNTSDFPFAIKPAILCVVVFGLTQVKQLKKLHPAWWLLSAAVIGVIFKF